MRDMELDKCTGPCHRPEALAESLGIKIKRISSRGYLRYGPGDWYCSTCKMLLTGWAGGWRCPCCKLPMRQMYWPDGRPRGPTARRKRALERRRLPDGTDPKRPPTVGKLAPQKAGWPAGLGRRRGGLTRRRKAGG